LTQTRLLAIGAACAVIAAAITIPTHIVHGQDEASVSPSSATAIPKFAVCSGNVNVASLLPGGAHEDPDVAAAGAFITLTESNLLQQVAQASSLDLYHQITLLGKTEIYDVNLSPLKDIACATCHASYTGFRGATSIFNATTASQPGGVPITNATPPEPNFRFGPRNPQSYAYAAFSPILHYNATQGSFYGGNFWDTRATGIRLGNPAAEQAQGPPVNPVEMGNIDSACVVWQCRHYMRHARSTACERSITGTSQHRGSGNIQLHV
jgi:cytochrome c peroxidase